MVFLCSVVHVSKSGLVSHKRKVNYPSLSCLIWPFKWSILLNCPLGRKKLVLSYATKGLFSWLNVFEFMRHTVPWKSKDIECNCQSFMPLT